MFETIEIKELEEIEQPRRLKTDWLTLFRSGSEN